MGFNSGNHDTLGLTIGSRAFSRGVSSLSVFITVSLLISFDQFRPILYLRPSDIGEEIRIAG